MAFYLLLGAVLLVVLLLGARALVQVNPAHLAQGFRAFVAAFGVLASTGLLLAGRFGLLLITISATVMAIRAMRQAGTGLGRFGGSGRSARTSEIATAMLRMQLDHASGELEGEVLEGGFAGRSLASLGLGDLLTLLAECQREDPRAVPLLETYLDRRQPDWRDDVTADGASGGHGPAASGPMDEATACSILGLARGAGVDEIKAAHRRLMTKLHPDHGGSDYLAAQLNQAKDYLLHRRG